MTGRQAAATESRVYASAPKIFVEQMLWYDWQAGALLNGDQRKKVVVC